ncbi:MAG: guanylate cyclase [Hyphomicrobiales bacterium]|nr:MAG: guanylate cyclase [Hyphomicrobiales bacterium]
MAGNFFSPITNIRKQYLEARERELEDAENNPHLRAALEQNKREGHKLAVYSRWVALAILGIMFPFIIPNWSATLYNEAILICFALLGWAQLKAGKVGQSKMELFLLFCDLALMTLACIIPNPFFDNNWPTPMQYRFGYFIYFFMLLAGATLAYSWRTIFAVGTWTTGLWASGVAITYYFGRHNLELATELKEALPSYPLMAAFFDPNEILLDLRVQEIILFLIVAGILALNGWRNNHLVLQQARIARERGNLARHFPPNIVDELAGQNDPFANIRSQPVAVLFADIVGFTRMAEQGSPENVVAMLRTYHQKLEHAVFDNHGTLDKFLGDGIMATFGSPTVGPNDAANAIQCARDMVTAIDQWNIERKNNGEDPVILSVGIHYGDVILGDIGSERRLEFATLGDTVNVASRLESLTRKLHTQVIISNAVVESQEATSPDKGATLLLGFQPDGKQSVRGRETGIDIWKLDHAA